MLSYYGERDHTRLQMTRRRRREGESRKNTRPRDYGTGRKDAVLLRGEKPKEERVRGWRGSLKQRRGDMKSFGYCIVSRDTHFRTVAPRRRSKPQPHDVLVVHCSFRTPPRPLHIRPLSDP